MDIAQRLKPVKMLICDVDGVMTNGRIWLNEKEEWVRQFNVRDGVGLKLLMKNDIQVAIISGGDSKDVRIRMKFLGVPHTYFGIEDKNVIFQDLLKKTNLKPENCAFIGDDIYDLPLLEKVGAAFTVADAVEELLEKGIFVTKRGGGSGAIREVVDLILKYSEHVKR
jgi:3-deoxy-D-manno-octulosonate 8-phosphate phosphatase (KDO 8-P phosphatase)